MIKVDGVEDTLLIGNWEPVADDDKNENGVFRSGAEEMFTKDFETPNERRIKMKRERFVYTKFSRFGISFVHFNPAVENSGITIEQIREKFNTHCTLKFSAPVRSSESAIRYGTLCLIYAYNDDLTKRNVVAAGFSIINQKAKDQFNKKIGRKRSFAQAMEKLVSKGIQKEGRRLFWNAFEKTCGR